MNQPGQLQTITAQQAMDACKRITAHEPGPWILGGCSGRMITTPSGYVGDGFIADVDTLANAKLIAAAPNMLDALRLAYNELPTVAALEAVSKAIEKATT